MKIKSIFMVALIGMILSLEVNADIKKWPSMFVGTWVNSNVVEYNYANEFEDGFNYYYDKCNIKEAVNRELKISRDGKITYNRTNDVSASGVIVQKFKADHYYPVEVPCVIRGTTSDSVSYEMSYAGVNADSQTENTVNIWFNPVYCTGTCMPYKTSGMKAVLRKTENHLDIIFDDGTVSSLERR